MMTETKVVSTMDDLPAFRDHWLEHGLSTDPADRAVAEAAIRRMYAAIGREDLTFLWFDSPSACIPLANALTSAGNGKSQLRNQLWNQLRNRLQGQLINQLKGQLGEQFGDELWRKLWDKLADQIWRQLWDQLWEQLREEEEFNNKFWDQFGGQLDTPWVAYFLFGEQLGVVYSAQERERLGWWADLARSCHWWWPFETVCILSERPEQIRMDGRSAAGTPVLHATDGPAVRYRDGYALDAVNGVRVQRHEP